MRPHEKYVTYDGGDWNKTITLINEVSKVGVWPRSLAEVAEFLFKYDKPAYDSLTQALIESSRLYEAPKPKPDMGSDYEDSPWDVDWKHK